MNDIATRASSAGLFLSEVELQELTGYKRHADQLRWLAFRKWKHEVSAIGRPIVGRSYAEAKLSDSQAEKKPEWSPNFSMFKRAA